MMLRFAMSMWVLDETGSATVFASVLAISIVPTILLSPFGGVLGAVVVLAFYCCVHCEPFLGSPL